ncbi:alpha/beta family hydrolase [Kitasatospora terrestris]|uniref:KANL3/Tex30 alpha/beta hydrolase-like domain-containing protein n=1 Tax=Kitasatospora terrestris TaxID=258051 RepID=A0ABP9DZN3_9ACTN
MQEIIGTPVGDARLTWFEAARAKALVVLGHGAGGGVEAADLQALARALPGRGITVVLAEQPWRVAGKRLAPAPKTLDAGWLPVVERVRRAGPPVFAGGRSAGARMACRTGRQAGAAGVVALAFPLHPPGKPERSRAEELLATGLPTLVVQGGADTFGGPEEFPALPGGHRMVEVPYGSHGFGVPKRAPVDGAATLGLITGAVGDWILEMT